MNSPQPKLIKEDLSQDQLDHYLKQDAVAVDCEMMGLNINRDRLCLVQLGDQNRNITLVQINKGQTQAPRLKQLLEADNTKIFHYARTDLSWLKHYLAIEVSNVFCTKIASKLARTYTDKHGLKDLCKEVVGKELNKQQQSSDWGAEIINKDQIKYAANDVVHLHEAMTILTKMLEREGRYHLAQEAFKFLPTIAEMDNFGYTNILEH
ncbi:MAG: ribonuclease D [Candidatus Melainabacteria bacterium]|nr:ribonuclease D [Candidatus Melainabacteria bacterium]